MLRKRAPFYNRGDNPVFVDFFERVLGSITALRGLAQCSTYHMYASTWAETTGLVLEPNPSLKMAVAIDQRLFIILGNRMGAF